MKQIHRTVTTVKGMSKFNVSTLGFVCALFLAGINHQKYIYYIQHVVCFINTNFKGCNFFLLGDYLNVIPSGLQRH